MSMNVTRTCCFGSKILLYSSYCVIATFVPGTYYVKHVLIDFLSRSRSRVHYAQWDRTTFTLSPMRLIHALNTPLVRCRYVISVAVSTAWRAAIFHSFRQFTSTICLAGTRQRRVTRKRHSASPAASVASEAASDVPESDRTEVHDSHGSVASRKTKKIKVVTNLTEEEEQTMVEWLEANPIIFNKKLQPYKDSARIDRQWEKKVTEVGKSVVVLKTWYTRLHSRHGMGVWSRRDLVRRPRRHGAYGWLGSWCVSRDI